jgi:hypothetical protein
MFADLFKPAYSREKLLLAFEYGVLLTQVAQQEGIEIDVTFMEKAEKMIEGEFATQTPTHLATQITPNILSVFELDLSK